MRNAVEQGTPFAGLEDPAENRLSMLVGASLALTPPARPLLMGRFGYGDWGVEVDAEDRGYLGDFEYQPTERCGDLVLIAGTSGMFPYVVEPVFTAAASGKLTVEINPEVTGISRGVEFSLHGEADTWLPLIERELARRPGARA